MARCWQWLAGRLPVPQFTWRFIKHFGQAPLEKASPRCNPIPSLRDTVMFLHELPQTMGERSVTGQGRQGGAGKGGRIGLCSLTSLPSYLSSSLMTNGSSRNSLSIHNRFSTFFFFLVSPSSPCCDRHLNWLSCAPGSDTTACCLLFVDYYWFSLILHLKINSQSRRKIGAVYTYFNILLCNSRGRSFGSSRDGSSQLRGKLLTGERERPPDRFWAFFSNHRKWP